MLRHRLTDYAERDITGILRQTRKLFGDRQLMIYAGLIDRAVELVTTAPLRPGSIERSELGQGVRSFHVALAARRRAASSHLLYYQLGDAAADALEVVILRVLHEAMEPRRRIVSALSSGQE